MAAFRLIIAVCFILLTGLSCAPKNEQSEDAGLGGFTVLMDLAAYKNTQFNPTLENAIDNDHNAVYAASLLYAWDQIRQTVQEPIVVDGALQDLTLLNNSKSYLGVLKPDEYQIKTEVKEGRIEASAEFSKSLLLKLKLDNLEDDLKFNNEKVDAYGVYGDELSTNGYFGDKEGAWEVIDILYYKDDNNFILKLIPKDDAHEIFYIKPSNALSLWQRC